MRSSTLVLMLLVALAALAACADPTGPPDLPPDDFELPSADPSLDPERIAVGEIIASPCAFGRWGDSLRHLRDRDEWATVDVYFGRGEGAPNGGPTLFEILRVRRADARVLHRFNVPAVRARMLLSRIPELFEGGGWIWVRDVPDAARYDVPVTVGFRDAVGERHEELFRTLGGRVEHRLQTIDALSGPLPDRSIPVLRRLESPKWLEAPGVLCLD